MSAEEPDTIAAARAEVERTREELGDTVEALAYKADVKARAHDKVDEAKAQAAERVEEVRTQATEKAAEVKAQAAEVRTQVAGTTEQVRAKLPPLAIAGIAAAGLLALVLVMRRRG